MSHRTAKSTVAIIFGALLPLCSSFGQPSNGEILGRLVAHCVTSAASDTDSLILMPDQRYDFLRTAVVNALRGEGKAVFLALDAGDQIAVEAAAHSGYWALTYRVESSTIRYSSDDGELTRSVVVGTRILVTADKAEVVADTLCETDFSDEIAGADLDRMEVPASEITRGERPGKGWLRRIAEPVIVAAASAVAVYLFFNVRSDKDESP